MSKILNNLQAEGNDIVLVAGSFAPAAGANPTAAFGTAAYSVVRNGTAGEWKLTFTEAYAQFLSGHAQVQLATAADLVAQLATFTAATPGVPATLLIRALAVAVPTDIAANANNRVHFQIWFRRTTFQT